MHTIRYHVLVAAVLSTLTFLPLLAGVGVARGEEAGTGSYHYTISLTVHGVGGVILDYRVNVSPSGDPVRPYRAVAYVRLLDHWGSIYDVLRRVSMPLAPDPGRLEASGEAVVEAVLSPREAWFHAPEDIVENASPIPVGGGLEAVVVAGEQGQRGLLVYDRSTLTTVYAYAVIRDFTAELRLLEAVVGGVRLAGPSDEDIASYRRLLEAAEPYVLSPAVSAAPREEATVVVRTVTVTVTATAYAEASGLPAAAGYLLVLVAAAVLALAAILLLSRRGTGRY